MGTVNAKISKELYEEIEDLPTTEKIDILEAVIRHQLYGEDTVLRGRAGMIYEIATKKRLTSVVNGRKGGRPKGAKTRPTVDEIRDYVEDNRLNVDPEEFYTYYSARNWKTGDEPIESWKGVVWKWHNSRDISKMNREQLIRALKA